MLVILNFFTSINCTRGSIDISSKPSEKTLYKLNTDGAADMGMCIAGIGAVIRDNQGNFIAGLAANIRTNTNATTEIWAIREGLKLAISKQIRCIHIETDSHMTFLILNGRTAERQVHRLLVKDMQALVLKFDEVWSSFCY